MTDQEKLEALKAYLTEQGIEFWVDVPSSRGVLPLYIPQYVIAVQIGDNAEWYKQLKNFLFPVFIRESDSIDFVIEKVVNTIKKYCSQKKSKSGKKEAQKKLSQNNLNSSQRKWRKLKARNKQRRTEFLKSLKPTLLIDKESKRLIEKPKRKRIRITASPIKIGIP